MLTDMYKCVVQIGPTEIFSKLSFAITTTVKSMYLQ